MDTSSLRLAIEGLQVSAEQQNTFHWGIRAWLGFASLHAFGIGGHHACLPLRSGSRGIATFRLLPNGSGVSVVLMLVDTLWRGSETWAKGQVCPAPLSTLLGPARMTGSVS